VALVAGVVGTPYSQQLIANGGNPPYAWRVISGALPRGLKLGRATGSITGIPTKRSVTSSFTIEARDTRSTTRPHTRNTATATFSIAIS